MAEKKVRMNSISGTVGKALMEHIDELNNIHTYEELKAFLENLMPEIEGNGKNRFMLTFNKKKDFASAFAYVYDYVLAGDGFRAIKTTYVKDGKRRQ